MSVTITKQAKIVYDYYRKIFSESLSISPLWDCLPIFDSLNTLLNQYKPEKTNNFFNSHNQEYLRRILDDFPTLTAVTYLLGASIKNEQEKKERTEEMLTMNSTLHSLVKDKLNLLQEESDQVSRKSPKITKVC